MTSDERLYCYSQSQQLMAQTGCIGHLRGDMGSTGEQFFSTWEDHQGQLKTQEFKDEFDNIINALRFEEAHGGVLASRRSLTNYCWDHPDSRLVKGEDDFGFRIDTENYAYISSWREADREQWNRARWFNGMDAAQTADENKTIVCGHWHTSYGHSKYEHKGTEFGEDADFSPYYGPGIIAIDACTAFSGKVNCLVIED